MVRRSLALSLLIALPALAAALTPFSPAEKVTDGAALYQASRNPAHTMAFDSTGRLHVTYFSGSVSTAPADPSIVYYRNWKLGEGWSAPTAVDRPTAPRIGARHPSLAVLPNDTVWIVWQDHRHCLAAKNYIDNTEIYGNFRPTGGDFQSADIRLTETASGHNGDNGYTPRLGVDATGKVSLAWFDFAAEATVADIYLRTSDTAGVFNPLDPFVAGRLTDFATRGATPPSFTVPDIALDAAGTRHLTWGTGEAARGDLYYGSVAAGGSTTTPQLLAAGSADYFDPPRIAVSPAGDVWIAYGDDSVVGGEDVVLRRLRVGQPSFDAPITIAANAARQYAPTIAFDAAGIVHLAWVDRRSGTQVYYGRFDPATSTLLEEQAITTTSASYSRPAIVIDPAGVACILYEVQAGGDPGGDLWFVRGAAPTHCTVWSDYK